MAKTKRSINEIRHMIFIASYINNEEAKERKSLLSILSKICFITF